MIENLFMEDDTRDFDVERHDRELPPTLNERIDAAYERVGRHIDLSFEQFQTSILASKTPDDEAVLWSGIAAVWDDYQRKYLSGKPTNIEQERKIVAALIAMSNGEQELSKLPVSLEVATGLLSCFVDSADELPFSSP